MHEPLKSCPFCGSKAVASINKSESLWSHDIVDWTRVHCTNDDCNAQTEPTCDGYEPSAIEVWNRRAHPVAPPQELSPDFTDTARAALLWVLWHHQGGSSPVGQPIRFALGMGQHDRLNEHQLAEAKRWERLHPVNPSVFPRWPELLTDGQIDAIWREKPRYHAAPIGVTDIEFARDIEAAAHGIGIKKENGNGLKT